MTGVSYGGVGERVASDASILSYEEAARLAVAAEQVADTSPKPRELAVSDGDKALMAALPEALEDVQFADHVVLKAGAEVDVTTDAFSLLPVVGPDRISQVTIVGGTKVYAALDRYGTYVKPEGAGCDHSESGVYLDAPAAIGLVYNGMIRAVASGAVEGDAIRIMQIQGMIPRNPSEEVLQESGLYSGIKWRHSLVEVWTAIAGNLGFNAIEVQGYVNNRWKKDYDPARTVRLKVGHDRVARQQGFAATPQGNWRKELVN